MLTHQMFDQAELIMTRLVIASAVAMTVEILFFRTRFESWTDFIQNMGLGLLGIFLVQGFMVLGLSMTNIFHATLILTTAPIITPLLGMLLGKEAFSLHKLVGGAVAFIGVFLLLFGGQPGGSATENPLALWGDLLILGNAVCFSTFLLLNKGILKKYNGFSVMAWWYTASALAFAVVFFGAGFLGYRPLATDLDLDFVKALSPAGWLLILYIAVPASLGTYGLNNFALRRTASSTVAMYIFLHPVIATSLGILVLDEPFSTSMLVAGLVVFSGVMLALQGEAFVNGVVQQLIQLQKRSYKLGRAISKVSRTGV